MSMRQSKKVSKVGSCKVSSSPLYSETKKSENTLDAKIKKWFRAFKGYKSSYNVNMLNCLILKYNLKMLNL